MVSEQRIVSLEVDMAELKTDVPESAGRVLEAIADLKSEMRSEFSVIKMALLALLDPRGPLTDPARADIREKLQS